MLNLKQTEQTGQISWKTNLILGSLGNRKFKDISTFEKNLYRDYDLYFINYKNSMLGVGGVGTVTRSLLKILPSLNMVCYDPHCESMSCRNFINSKNVFAVNLEHQEAELFHGSYAKLYMWPVLHNQVTAISESKVKDLRRIFSNCSKLFAERAVEISDKNKTPIFWVNDYNLICVPGYIREKVPNSKIIFSLRTPFGVTNLPSFFDTDAKMFIESLLQADIISFHRERDVLNFFNFVKKYFNNDSRVNINWEEYTIEFDNHTVIPRAFPMGNDPEYRIALSRDKKSTVIKDSFTSITKGKIITSVSRFDQTKGVNFELDCIESLLKNNPQLREKFTFLRISYLSDRKKNTQAYKTVYDGVLDRIKKLNKTYGTKTWQPIVGRLNKKLSDIEMTGLFRSTDILFIGSLADGFNHIIVESIMSKTLQDSPIQIVTTDVGAIDYLEGYHLIDQKDVIKSSDVLYNTLRKGSLKAWYSYGKLRKSASRLYAYNWAINIIQASIDITKVPVLYKKK